MWTAHNLVSHDGYHPKLEAFFWRNFVPMLNGVIALSADSLSGLRELRKLSSQTKTLVVPHGNYSGVYPDDTTRTAARKKLGIPDERPVLLNLGVVRSYKKVERLIELARQRSDLYVVIAGKVMEANYEAQLTELLKELSNVTFYKDFVSDEDLQYYLRAADLFVLPYDKITNSGSAILALSYDLPVLAPDLGCFQSLRTQFGDDFVKIYKGQFCVQAVDQALGKKVIASSGVEWGDWGWPVIAKRVTGLFEAIID